MSDRDKTLLDKGADAEAHPHCYVRRGRLALPYQYFAGRVGSRFLVALRDSRKILGVRCDTCKQVFVPPRQTCERCFAWLADSWVELPSTGTVTSFTVVRYADAHLPRKPPYVLALVKLDGADTPIAHVVAGVEPEAVTVGMRVTAVFAAETTRTIMDVDHFAPA